MDTVNPLVIDIGKLWTQDIVDHPVAPTPAGVSSFNDFAPQLHIECAGLALMAKGISTWPHKSAGVACGQSVMIDHAAGRLAFDLWG